ncbi:MAG: hypothetical protein IJS67_02060, partial [Clostridia bacterium]|nr:hypothetical protein [Clostridia bacterium]
GVLAVKATSPDGSVFRSEKKVFGSINSILVTIENPELWYPNGYGGQPLYDYEVALISGGEVLDEKRGRFGIRKLEIREPLKEDGTQRFDTYVNGVRIRAIGGNWVPISSLTGAIPSEKYYRLLHTAKECGVNTMRVWGGGIYESDEFYSLCDEFGILVWQDFMFSCQSVPEYEEFKNEIVKEATEQVKRLRNHPSLMIWCGGNEITDAFKVGDEKEGRFVSRILLRGIVAEYDGERKYVYNSPYSVTDVGNDVGSGDCHKNAHAIATHKRDLDNYRKYQWANINAYDSECALLGMCRLRSFKKFIPEDKLWPQNEIWRARLVGNPHDYCIQDFTERLTYIAESMFGKSDTLEDFIKKSMTAHADFMASEIDYYRSHEINSGVLCWMYNDDCGNGTWSIIDDSQEPKPALYALKRAGKRKRVSITEEKEGFFVNVINDSAEDYDGELYISHETFDGKVISEKSLQISVKGFTQIREKIDFEERKDAFLYAKTDFDRTIFYYKPLKDRKFTTDISVNKKADGKRAEVTVKANEFARTVFIDLPDGYFPILDDNYFDLKRGEEVRIRITAEKDISKSDVKVLTFADEWAE